MPVAKVEVSDNRNHEEVKAEEERMQSGVANEDTKEEINEQDQEEMDEEKYEEATEIPVEDGELLDKQQEQTVNKTEDVTEDKEEEENQLREGQGASETAEDQEDKFEEIEELQSEDGCPLVKNQDGNENIMQGKIEDLKLDEKQLEGGQGTSELAEIEEVKFEEATELQSEDHHPLENESKLSEEKTQDGKKDEEESENQLEGAQRATEAAEDQSKVVVSVPPKVAFEHPFEMMHDVSESKVQGSMKDGEEKTKQLEERKEPTDAAEEHKETVVSMPSRSETCEGVQGVAETAALLHSEVPDACVPSDQFVDTEGLMAAGRDNIASRPGEGKKAPEFCMDNIVSETESILTDIGRAETVSAKPGETEERSFIKEPAVEEGMEMYTGARKKNYSQDDKELDEEHWEAKGSSKNGNLDGVVFDGKELESRVFHESEVEAGDVDQQIETKISNPADVHKETRDTVEGTEASVSPADHYLTNQEIVPEVGEVAEKDLRASAYPLNLNEHENHAQGIGSVNFRDAGKAEDAIAVEGIESKDAEGKTELHDDIDEAQVLPVNIEKNSEIHDNSDDAQVVLEAIPVPIEEKVIPDEDGKLKDQLRQTDEPLEEISEAFNDTNGRAKKPVPDATFKVESQKEKTMEHPNDNSTSIVNEKHQLEVESEDDETEEDEDEQDTIPLMTSTVSATGGSNNTPVSGSGLSLPGRPAGLGSSIPLLEPAPRSAQHSRANGTSSSRPSQLVEDTSGESDENNETREKLQMIRVKFLRLAHRLGQTPHNVVVAQVLYRLGLAEQLRGSRNSSRTGAFSFDRASAMAEQQEAAGQEGLDFTCTIMVLGKTGVGKSATINSIFDEVKSETHAFQVGTRKVQEIVGTVQGIKVRVIDTPGLLASFADQRHNEKILMSVKRFIKKTPPDIVLYFDRLDMQSRDYGDLPLLRTITETFGAAVWFNAIVVLTHAASAPPDGPNGTPMSYEMFVAQRSHVVQQAIRQAAGDMRLMNPVSLVENHSACRTNRAGQRVLPNGQIWKPQLLLLCFASKILAEANALLKLQDSTPGKAFGTRPRVPPLPFLLSSLLQSRAQLKLPEEQFGDEDASDEDLDEASDSEDESEYDRLPPFRRLTKSQIDKLDKEKKKAYFDELEYREKLFMKKQLKEERRRRRFLKKMPGGAKEETEEYDGNIEEENAGAASVPVPMPDMVLPPSFDADNPTHRYRYLDTSSQWLVRPVLETHGWDHDIGYEGLNLEKTFVIGNKVPVSVSGQVTKDKKEANLQMECAGTLKHGEGKVTLAGLDIQTVGKELAYTVRSETRFSNFKHNKTTAGLAITLLGDALAAGMKLEDRLMIGKRFKLVLNGGAITGRGDVAYGGSVEATLRDKDYPIGRSQSTLGLSIMDWHGDLAIGCNLQSQFPVGRNTTMVARANLNNRGAGQVSIRLSSSEQLQIALIGLIPIFRTLIGNRLFGSSQPM
eukprot:Gb_20310 [translate_table: standard]